MSGVDFSLVAGEVQGGSAAWPRLNDEAGGDDLATMKTKNKVLAGDLFTGEGERSSGKVQQYAVKVAGEVVKVAGGHQRP